MAVCRRTKQTNRKVEISPLPCSASAPISSEAGRSLRVLGSLESPASCYTSLQLKPHCLSPGTTPPRPDVMAHIVILRKITGLLGEYGRVRTAV